MAPPGVRYGNHARVPERSSPGRAVPTALGTHPSALGPLGVVTFLFGRSLTRTLHSERAVHPTQPGRKGPHISPSNVITREASQRRL